MADIFAVFICRPFIFDWLSLCTGLVPLIVLSCGMFNFTDIFGRPTRLSLSSSESMQPRDDSVFVPCCSREL